MRRYEQAQRIVLGCLVLLIAAVCYAAGVVVSLYIKTKDIAKDAYNNGRAAL